LREAVQLMFLAQIALWSGDDHALTAPGRIDRTLRHFYEADLAAGRTTRRAAFELICSLYIRMNDILGPGSALSVMVGGRDAQGRDVTNELTYLALAARQATQLVYPTVAVAWHRDTPQELTDYGVHMLATGIGDPAFFNDDLIALGLRDHGVSEEDCRDYMNSTCVEIKVVGRSNMWVTQPYFNLAQALLEAMQAEAGDAAPTFENLQSRFKSNISGKIAAAAGQLHGTWQARTERGCFPLASCLTRDCLEKGVDFDRGGARYNWVENSFVGLANLADGMMAVKQLVFEEKVLTLAEFCEILGRDFEGHEALRRRVIAGMPSYGSDDDRADIPAAEWARYLVEATERCTVGVHRYVPGFFCWIQHERLGSQTGATPDGRRSGLPLADGAGASQGRERRGPTAGVLSTTKWSHRPVLGGLVHNIKLSKSILESSDSRAALRAVIETYLERGGFEIQVNVVGVDTLKDAQRCPQKYPDLLVRVAGYSDYFVHLNRKMQDEVIARNTHEL
jgi:formate C-acetyltransferase